MISESPARTSAIASRHRWQSRRWSALLLRSVSFVVPVLAAVLTGLLIVRILPAPANGLGVAAWWLALIGGAVLAMNVFDRLARRVLPLAWLLRMTMAFPDDAPSRMRVLLKSGTAGDAAPSRIRPHPTLRARTLSPCRRVTVPISPSPKWR